MGFCKMQIASATMKRGPAGQPASNTAAVTAGATLQQPETGLPPMANDNSRIYRQISRPSQ